MRQPQSCEHSLQSIGFHSVDWGCDLIPWSGYSWVLLVTVDKGCDGSALMFLLLSRINGFRRNIERHLYRIAHKVINSDIMKFCWHKVGLYTEICALPILTIYLQKYAYIILSDYLVYINPRTIFHSCIVISNWEANSLHICL